MYSLNSIFLISNSCLVSREDRYAVFSTYCVFLIPNSQSQRPVQLLHTGRGVFQFI